MDEDDKSSFRGAITAWIIVLIILICFLAVMIYLVKKGKEVLAAEGEELRKQQTQYEKRKNEVPVTTAGGPRQPGKMSTGEDEVVMGGYP